MRTLAVVGAVDVTAVQLFFSSRIKDIKPDYHLVKYVRSLSSISKRLVVTVNLHYS